MLCIPFFILNLVILRLLRIIKHQRVIPIAHHPRVRILIEVAHIPIPTLIAHIALSLVHSNKMIPTATMVRIPCIILLIALIRQSRRLLYIIIVTHSTLPINIIRQNIHIPIWMRMYKLRVKTASAHSPMLGKISPRYIILRSRVT